jgi:hypothetical protein
MAIHVHDASHAGDRPSYIKWIPLVVPAAAGVITALIFLGMWFVLAPHY